MVAMARKVGVLTRRTQALIDEMAEELGRQHGWKKTVADRLGLHPSTLSKIVTGSRPVTPSGALRIAARLRLDPSYFKPDCKQHYRALLTEMDADLNAMQLAVFRSDRTFTDLAGRAQALLAKVAESGRNVEPAAMRDLAVAVLEVPVVRLARQIAEVTRNSRNVDEKELAELGSQLALALVLEFLPPGVTD